MKTKLNKLHGAVTQATQGLGTGVLTALALGLGMALPAGAQAASDQKVEEIQVTGTRIKSPGVVSNSPITSIGDEEIRSSQPIAVEEFIKNLPAAVPAIGPGTNNGAGGGATIDLRGFGPSRTLVLLDGRRVVPFDLFARVDSNVIPLALLKRVDLVTGGASAVYGADAITGVVNFVLRHDFKGVDVSTTYGTSTHNDAQRKRTDITIGAGTADGKGNVAMSVGFTETQALREDARTIGLFALSSTTGAVQGSGTTLPVAITVPSVAGITNPIPGAQQLNLATGTIVPQFNTFNTNPDNFYQTPLRRKQVTAVASYFINNYAEIYAQSLFTRSDVLLQLAATGSFGNTYQVTIGNPYLPDPARQQICQARGIPAAQCVVGNGTLVPMALSRRFVEFGPRLNPYSTKTLQNTVGLKGDIAAGWTYDAYWSYGESDQTQQRVNWGAQSKLNQALNAVNTTTCVVNTNGCVPFNIFGDAGTVTKAMKDFVNLTSIQTATVTQSVGSASATGDLGGFKSPWASAPINAAVGAEYRKLYGATLSDGPAQIQAEVLGTGAPTPDRSGQFTLKEAFMEAIVPLLSDMPFARRLSLETGYRRTKFTTNSSTSYGTYKYGLEWETVPGFRMRATSQHATRAPNVNELYQPQVSNLSNLAVDYCQGANINQAQANTAGTLSNLCRLTGVPLGTIGSLAAPSSGQINQRTAGNSALGPETADTRTIGFVWQPTFAKGAALSLDYYDIKLTNAISNPSTTDILDACYKATLNPNYTFNASCTQVLRSATTGTLNGDALGVVTPLTNQGLFRTNGYDLNVSYGFALKDLGLDPAMGRVELGLLVNRVKTYQVQPTPSSLLRDCLGYYSVACGTNLGISPQTKLSQRGTWTVGDFSFSYNLRYQSGLKVEPLVSPAPLPAFSAIPSYIYGDLGMVWHYSKNLRLNLSIVNVGDKAPPNVGNTIGTTAQDNGNTFPQSYDVVGRFYTLGLTLKF